MKTWNNFVLEEDENDLEENAFLKSVILDRFLCLYCGLYQYNMRLFSNAYDILHIHGNSIDNVSLTFPKSKRLEIT